MNDRSKVYFRSALAAVLATVGLVVATVTPVAADEPKPSQVAGETQSDEPTPSESRGGSQPRQWPGRNCDFDARAHDPHLSGGDASGHGSWVNTSNPRSECPSRARVTVRLEAKKCQYTNPLNCFWKTVKETTIMRYAKQQVAVHYPCHTTESTWWRTRVNVRVAIDGWFDKWDSDTNVRKLNCRPRR